MTMVLNNADFASRMNIMSYKEVDKDVLLNAHSNIMAMKLHKYANNATM